MATPSHPVPAHENTGFPVTRVPLCGLPCKPSGSSWETPICFRLSSSTHVLTVASQDLASLSMGPGNIKGTVNLAALSSFPSLSCPVFWQVGTQPSWEITRGGVGLPDNTFKVAASLPVRWLRGVKEALPCTSFFNLLQPDYKCRGTFVITTSEIALLSTSESRKM